MKSNIWTEKALKKATEIYDDGISVGGVQLSENELDSIAEQLTDLVYFSPDEKIEYFAHIERGHDFGEGILGKPLNQGDFIVTGNKLLYGEHPITQAKTGLFSSQKTVHHDRYSKPISVKVNLDAIEKVVTTLVGGQDCLEIGCSDQQLRFYCDQEACANANVELEKLLDAYIDKERKPKALEVVHKGSIVNVNVDNKGYLLNVDPCPTCGANLSLSPDRKTAYCKYCKKEIPTMEQLKE